MKADELKSSKKYWFLSRKNDTVAELTLMNKVHNRKVYRFAEEGKQKLFRVHVSRLSQLYSRKWEAKTALNVLLGQRQIRMTQDRAYALANAAVEGQPRAYYNGNAPLNPPRIDQWQVARGFPLRPRIGRW